MLEAGQGRAGRLVSTSASCNMPWGSKALAQRAHPGGRRGGCRAAAPHGIAQTGAAHAAAGPPARAALPWAPPRRPGTQTPARRRQRQPQRRVRLLSPRGPPARLRTRGASSEESNDRTYTRTQGRRRQGLPPMPPSPPAFTTAMLLLPASCKPGAGSSAPNPSQAEHSLHACLPPTAAAAASAAAWA